MRSSRTPTASDVDADVLKSAPCVTAVPRDAVLLAVREPSAPVASSPPKRRCGVMPSFTALLMFLVSLFTPYGTNGGIQTCHWIRLVIQLDCTVCHAGDMCLTTRTCAPAAPPLSSAPLGALPVPVFALTGALPHRMCSVNVLRNVDQVSQKEDGAWLIVQQVRASFCRRLCWICSVTTASTSVCVTRTFVPHLTTFRRM